MSKLYHRLLLFLCDIGGGRSFLCKTCRVTMHSHYGSFDTFASNTLSILLPAWYSSIALVPFGCNEFLDRRIQSRYVIKLLLFLSDLIYRHGMGLCTWWLIAPHRWRNSLHTKEVRFTCTDLAVCICLRTTTKVLRTSTRLWSSFTRNKSKQQRRQS